MVRVLLIITYKLQHSPLMAKPPEATDLEMGNVESSADIYEYINPHANNRTDYFTLKAIQTNICQRMAQVMPIGPSCLLTRMQQ